MGPGAIGGTPTSHHVTSVPVLEVLPPEAFAAQMHDIRNGVIHDLGPHVLAVMAAQARGSIPAITVSPGVAVALSRVNAQIRATLGSATRQAALATERVLRRVAMMATPEHFYGVLKTAEALCVGDASGGGLAVPVRHRKQVYQAIAQQMQGHTTLAHDEEVRLQLRRAIQNCPDMAGDPDLRCLDRLLSDRGNTIVFDGNGYLCPESVRDLKGAVALEALEGKALLDLGARSQLYASYGLPVPTTEMLFLAIDERYHALSGDLDVLLRS